MGQQAPVGTSVISGGFSASDLILKILLLISLWLYSLQQQLMWIPESYRLTLKKRAELIYKK